MAKKHFFTGKRPHLLALNTLKFFVRFAVFSGEIFFTAFNLFLTKKKLPYRVSNLSPSTCQQLLSPLTNLSLTSTIFPVNIKQALNLAVKTFSPHLGSAEIFFHRILIALKFFSPLSASAVNFLTAFCWYWWNFFFTAYAIFSGDFFFTAYVMNKNVLPLRGFFTAFIAFSANFTLFTQNHRNSYIL